MQIMQIRLKLSCPSLRFAWASGKVRASQCSAVAKIDPKKDTLHVPFNN
ncbi:MAG: hypothetical protein ACI9R3_004711 [Verrucomicrobiales bacterium]|jgi:hypothetical protein